MPSGVAGRATASAAIDLTPLILTFNESPNIARCLAPLAWAPRVIVLDSGSTDDTVALCRRFPNVEVVTRTFDDHATQWNYGAGLAGTTWILALDADYIVSDAFVSELRTIVPAADVDAVAASFRYCVYGRPLRGSLYPPRPVLFRRDRCRYEPDGHTQRLRVAGTTLRFQASIDHDDRKPLSRWLTSQSAYAQLEAEKLLAQRPSSLSLPDRVRRAIVPAPPLAFVYALIGKLAILDGWRGMYYALQRATAEVMLSLALLDRRLRR